MNKQRKVVITTTYNEMGIIIDTKVEELGTSAQPEPCEDTISRQAAIDVVMKCYFNDDLFEAYEYELNELPSAQPHTGTWTDHYGMFACSECGREYIQRHHYCPHCGTKMLRENEG